VLFARFNHFAEVIDSQRRLTSVQYGVTVWAHRAKILLRIHDIFFADCGQRHNMVYMDESRPELTVFLLKINPAHETPSTVIGQTGIPRSTIPLVRINRNGARRSFFVTTLPDFFWCADG
jgi:hypothetical protein